MNHKVILSLLAASVLISFHPALAQQPKKVHRIGYLSSGNPTSESIRSEPIRQALREIGYIEGQNITFEYRYGEGKIDRYSALAAELVGLKVDIIVVGVGVWRPRRPRMRPRRFPSL